jgi:uncharacterized membrane protein YphA (DoxX/SURF4 family)
MNWMTRVFLVLLRLAIGWHFFFEGLEKVESVWRGPTETSRPFTSEGYLREASGPLGEVMRQQIGDLDAAALERMKVEREHISPALAKDWDDYLQRFTRFYGLDKRQEELAKTKLQQSKDQAERWLLHGSKDVDKTLGTTSFKVHETTQQRIDDYRDTLNKIKDVEDHELPAFQHDVEKDKLRTLKADAVRMRTQLLADLNQPMQESLQEVLTDDQKKAGPVPPPAHESVSEWTSLQWIDAVTRWGLVLVGLGLLLGLFTRTSCVAGALFLLLLYLAVPPFPWLPEATRVEGHYFFVNKNLIEMLALLVLATTRSGRWLGLDGLLHALLPWNWQSRRVGVPVRGHAVALR